MLMVPLKIECTSTRYWKINILSSSSFKKNHCTFPTGIRRNNNAIMTSKRRRVDVIITLFLRQVSAELLLMSLLPEWLTHWGQGKMDTISQTIFSNAFSWMKMFQLRLKFHWCYFQGSNKQYSSIGSDNGLVPARRQAIIWTNGG